MVESAYDVAIVGAGPVGLVIAGQLARRGHSVTVIERHAAPFALPRAVRFDGQAMRLFQSLGIIDEISPEVVAAESYVWYGADGDPIVNLDESQPTPSGWAHSYLFWQPTLETALDRLARESPNIDLRRGWQVDGLTQDDHGVELELHQGETGADGLWEPTGESARLSARYVVGADGANSAVRTLSGIALEDLGFSEQWLVVDVRPEDMSAWQHLPAASQHCDPARPTAMVRAGAHHRRWEFMVLPGEDAQALATPEAVWGLLAPYLAPTEGELVRRVVYTFTGRIAAEWHSGRVALAGDAAHTMPPFLGEGLCTGLRDATNLAWRLDLMLSGISTDELLEDYQAERYAHARALIELSVAMGRVSCTLDREQAAKRDAAFRSGQAPPPPPRPGLTGGTLQADPRDEHVTGQLAVQGVVRTAAGDAGRFDDVVGTGFALVLRHGDPATVMDAEDHSFLARIGAHVVTLGPGAEPATVTDLDGTLTAWLDANRLAGVLIRPDGYAFGTAASVELVPELVHELRTRLSAQITPAAAV